MIGRGFVLYAVDSEIRETELEAVLEKTLDVYDKGTNLSLKDLSEVF